MTKRTSSKIRITKRARYLILFIYLVGFLKFKKIGKIKRQQKEQGFDVLT